MAGCGPVKADLPCSRRSGAPLGYRSLDRRGPPRGHSPSPPVTGDGPGRTGEDTLTLEDSWEDTIVRAGESTKGASPTV